MLTIEPRMVSIFLAHSPISFEHMSFWHWFLDSRLTRYPSNIGVQIIVVVNFSTSTLGVVASESAKYSCEVCSMVLPVSERGFSLGGIESIALMYERILDFRPSLLPALEVKFFLAGLVSVAIS